MSTAYLIPHPQGPGLCVGIVGASHSGRLAWVTTDNAPLLGNGHLCSCSAIRTNCGGVSIETISLASAHADNDAMQPILFDQCMHMYIGSNKSVE